MCAPRSRVTLQPCSQQGKERNKGRNKDRKKSAHTLYHSFCVTLVRRSLV